MKWGIFALLSIGSIAIAAVVPGNDSVPLYVFGKMNLQEKKQLPNCPAGQALSYNTTTHQFVCVTTTAATSLACSGCVTDAMLTDGYGGAGSCTPGRFVTGLNRDAAPTCATPPDFKGDYTHGGYVTGSYTKNVAYSAYLNPRDAHGYYMTFTTMVAGTGGTTGTAGVYALSTGTMVCKVNVNCTAGAGTIVSGPCNMDGSGAPPLVGGETYLMKWDTGSTCTTMPGGNTAIVVTED